MAQLLGDILRGQRHVRVALALALLAGLHEGTFPRYSSAAGAVYTVGTLSDGAPSLSECASPMNTTCTLRSAIAAAASGTDTIQFRSGLGGAIVLDGARGSLVLNTSVVIRGPGAGLLAVDGGYRGGAEGTTAIRVNANAVVTIEGLAVQRGRGSVVVGTDDGGHGGGIFNTGTLTLQDDDVHDSVTGAGTSSGTGGAGAGIYNSGHLTIRGSTVRDNTTGTGGTNGSGGGIFNAGTLVVSDSTISGNAAGRGGIGGNGGGIANNGTATVTGSTISGNATRGTGGVGYSGVGAGIANNGTLTLVNSAVRGNTASGFGGGISNTSTGTITHATSETYGNTAARSGGGIVSDGGLTITGSAIYDNTASENGGGYAGYGTLTIATSTFARNAAVSGMGGGIASYVPVQVAYSTIALNTATSGGGIALIGGGTLRVGSTLLGSNTGGAEPDIRGVVGTDDDYNLVSDTSGVSGLTGAHDVLDKDPLLDTLAMHGGPTQTVTIRPESPAFNAGRSVCPTTDQRGVARPQGSACDIGAVEMQAGNAPAQRAVAPLVAAATPMPIPPRRSTTVPTGTPLPAGPIRYPQGDNGGSTATATPAPVPWRR